MNLGDLLTSRSAWRAGLGLLLAVLAVPAFALGLGQIRVKSQPGQPLLAEIPIVTSDPAELQGLQARLASPETFRRIGLEPPQGIVSDLQFTPAVDEAGQPVIRVTSRAPVQQAGLTFLVEVDWGQGRLVREYSALVDAPRTVAAPVAPPVQAPSTETAGVIDRPAQPAAPPAAEPAPEPAPEPTPVAAAPQPAAPTPPVAPPPPPPQPAAPAPPPAPQAGNETVSVQRGDTLGKIASELPGTRGYSLDQTMLALLRTNPDAFIGEDINRLRAGSVLRVPGSDELSRYDTSEAAAIVREQISNWRQARRAQAQPVADATATATAATSEAPQQRRAATETQAPAAPRRAANARLEIAPPQAAAGTRAGTQSGASAGGEGEMLRQELQQTKETLAARDAEVQELKTRVAELEELQQEQQKLIAMKDSALAGAQQRMSNADAAQPAQPAATQASTEPPQAGFAWWWLLPAALLVGVVAWWLGRRKSRAAAPKAPAASVSESFAASHESVAAPKPASAPKSTAAPQPEPEPAAAATPVWASKAGRPATAPAKPVVAKTTTSAPTWMAGSAAADADAIAPLNQAPAGSERIELARAYVELGDKNTARTLLQEVIDSGDADARDAAARMLQTLT